MLAALIAMIVALEVTPAQTVSVAGQVIQVGARPRLSWSGPGLVDLFGQQLPTIVSFPGPVQPTLQLSQLTLDSQLTTFVQGSGASKLTQLLGARLAAGFARYAGWEDAIATGIALLLTGALAGWRRLPARRTIRLLAVTLAVSQVVNLGAVALSAYGAQHALHRVHSLSQLVGSSPLPTAAPPRRPARKLSGVQEVVIGDSTAAGAGLPHPAGASATAKSCGRSDDAYAADLAQVNGWHVVNLACDSATIRNGLLGPQTRGGRLLVPQLDAASRVQHPAVVIVSVGADDLHWSAVVEYCAVSPRCDNRATTAYFQKALAAFSTDYLRLLIRLGSLPGHPRVLVNEYYDPFSSDLACITGHGLTDAKIRFLSTWLSALNKTLAAGAKQFGDLAALPSFAGHQLCSAESYVQGLSEAAPFHPTAAGQLAIALADQRALATTSSP